MVGQLRSLYSKKHKSFDLIIYYLPLRTKYYQGYTGTAIALHLGAQ